MDFDSQILYKKANDCVLKEWKYLSLNSRTIDWLDNGFLNKTLNAKNMSI